MLLPILGKSQQVIKLEDIEILRESSFTPIINEQEIAYGLIILKKLDLDYNKIERIKMHLHMRRKRSYFDHLCDF